MEYWKALKAIVVAISLAITALFGVSGGQDVANQQATSTIEAVDAAVAQQVASSTDPANDPVVQIYELGKSVGRLQQQVESIKKVATSSEATSTPVGSAPIIELPAPPVINQTTMTQVSKASLEIINPLPGKGLGRSYKASSEVKDESNYISIGLVCRGDNGEVTNTPKVTVIATDASQNKIMEGTGNITKVYKDGIPETVHYYPFTYEFRTAGQHTITFECGNLTKAVTVEVAE